MTLFPSFYHMRSPKTFLAQLPKLCCKAQTGLEHEESAMGRAAPEGLAGLKSLLQLARKQLLTRASVLLASRGGKGAAREESKGSLPYKILGNPLSKKLPAAVLPFSTTIILPDVFFHNIYEYSQNSVQEEYRSMEKGVTFYCIYKYFVWVAFKCAVGCGTAVVLAGGSCSRDVAWQVLDKGSWHLRGRAGYIQKGRWKCPAQ